MKFHRLLPLLAVALLFAGCGGGGSAKLAADDVAVVSGTHITQSQYNTALAEEKAQLKDEGESVPSAGSSGFETLKTDIVDELVQQTELGLEAAKLGISVTPAELAAKMVAFKKQCCGGSEKKYLSGLKQQGYTDPEIQQTIRERLLEEKLYNSVTKGSTATAAEVAAYYAQNISQYQQPATRNVEEILVGKNKKALAQQIYSQLKGGANFGKLAKKYSQDPGSKDKGGLFTATKGTDVPQFDAAVFASSAKTGVLLEPVNTSQYGWFVIEPLANIKPALTESEAKAAPKIRSTLNSTKQQAAAQTWLTGIEKSYCGGGKISYQTGYTPSPDPCTTLSTSNQTTT